MGEQLNLGIAQTSLDALATVDVKGIERAILNTVTGFGSKGCISDQIRLALPAHSYPSITARYKSMTEKKLIEVIGTRPGLSGRQQRVYRATKIEGQAHA